MPRPIATPVTWSGQSFREPAPTLRPDLDGVMTKSPAKVAAERRMHASRVRMTDGMLSERAIQHEDPMVAKRKAEAQRRVEEAQKKAKEEEKKRLKEYQKALRKAEEEKRLQAEKAKREEQLKIEAALRKFEVHGLTEADFKNEYDLKQLCEACVNGNVESVAGLLRVNPAHSDVMVCGKVTPLMIATVNGHIELMMRFIASKARIDQPRTCDGKWPLLGAIDMGPDGLEVAKALIAHGANIEKEFDGGLTPLLYAIKAGPAGLEVAKLLLAQGANIDKAAADGVTPILMAAMACDADRSGIVDAAELGAMIETTELLIRMGVKNVDAPNAEGVTALAIAQEREFKELEEILRAAGASDEPIRLMEEARKERAREKHRERLAAIKIQSVIRGNQEKKRFRARMQKRAEERKKAEEEAKAAAEKAKEEAKKAAEEAKAKKIAEDKAKMEARAAKVEAELTMDQAALEIRAFAGAVLDIKAGKAAPSAPLAATPDAATPAAAPPAAAPAPPAAAPAASVPVS